MVSVLPIYMASTLHADKSTVGLVLASFMIASVTIRPFSGFALDKYGRRTIFTTALLINSILFLGYFIATHSDSLTILRIAHGVAWGVTTISGSIVAVDIIPSEKRGEGLGYFGLSTTMGMAVGPVIGLFIGHHLGYSTMFAAAVAISFVSYGCASFMKYPKVNKTETVHFSWGGLFDKSSMGTSLNLLIIMSAYGGLLSFVALYGKEIGVINTSWFFLVFAIGIASSRFAMGQVLDKKGPGKIITICLLLLIGGFIYLAMAKNIFVYYSSGILLGFGVGAVFPTFQTMVNNLAKPERRGAANSTLYTALDLGMGAGMVFTGYIAESFSISSAFIVCAVICVFGLIVFRISTLSFYNRNNHI